MSAHQAPEAAPAPRKRGRPKGTPCSAETAFAQAPKEKWHLPATIRATIPAALLEGPAAPIHDHPVEEIDDEGPF